MSASRYHPPVRPTFSYASTDYALSLFIHFLLFYWELGWPNPGWRFEKKVRQKGKQAGKLFYQWYDDFFSAYLIINTGIFIFALDLWFALVTGIARKERSFIH